MLTVFLGSITRPDGFHGDYARVYLCRGDCPTHGPDTVFAVSPSGWYSIPADCWPTSLEQELLIGF